MMHKRLALDLVRVALRMPWERMGSRPAPPPLVFPDFMERPAAAPLKRPEPAAVQQAPVQQEEACPACLAAHEANVLLGFTRGMVTECGDGDGPLPEGVGGTMPLAATALRNITDHLQEVPRRYPEETGTAVEIAQRLAGVATRLRWVPDCAAARELHAEVEELHTQVYQMTLRAKRRERQQGLEPQVAAPG